MVKSMRLIFSSEDRFLNFLRKYIGTRDFYKQVLVLTVPIMIQNGITNFVNMLDNVMVGRIGTVEMTGVAVTNQLFFVFNLCIFGAVSGAGIFGAQFHGNGDTKGVRDTFRFKVLFCSLICLLGIGIFVFFGRELIDIYLRGEGNPEDAAASLEFAREYMNIMLIGLLPYTVVQCYSSTLRETGKSVPPMYAGIIAVVLNLVLNYLLIFDHFGFKGLGVNGAAIATVVSRFAELMIISVWTHVHRGGNRFIIGAFKSIRIPRALIWQITLKGLPLMVNEALWASGMAVLNQCYSLRGLDVVAANNISQTFFNVFSVAFMAVGAGIGIIVGQNLGANEPEKAMDSARKLITFSLLVSIVVSLIYIFCAEFIPRLYNTTDAVKDLATKLMQISAAAMPLDAFANASYFTLRSGGKVFTTFIFDSCFVWVVSVPVAVLLSRCTGLPILPIYAICCSLSFIKDVIGFIFVKKGFWIKNLTNSK